MINEKDPLKIAIEKSEWAKKEENKPHINWLHKNYEFIRIDDDNKEQVRYLYQHINRSGMTIIVDKYGDIKDGYLDTSDYWSEAAVIEKFTKKMQAIGEKPFDLLNEDDKDWESDYDHYYSNDEYTIVYKPKGGSEVPIIPEDNKIEQLSWALWVINKQAKAYRDNLKFNLSDYSSECINYFEVMRDNYYTLKAYAFKKLHKDNKLDYEGIHIGKDGVTEYPYVKFGGRGFHLVAKGKYFEAFKKKNSKVNRKPLPKIESIDHSLRNDRQAELAKAEKVVCDFLQPGMYEELWFKIEKEKKRITREEKTGNIKLVD
ncbi:hypothetical protein [Priestia aryabhattai]|uniref:hypothetical protein n=1 Tax=Priestia aryabhattai TaxID=412384 RepID=UPI003736CDB4